MSLPEPLTPADCDLRDFHRMMIDIPRLFGSSFNASASRDPLAWMIGHKLWYRSWSQIPAASLPDNDEELCYIAELGFDTKTFLRAKALAMRGWVKCSDGRLYHPVVAEAALTAWESKQQQRWRTECARIKKHNQRHGTKVVSPDFETYVSTGCAPVPLSVPVVSPEKSDVVPRDNAECPEGKGLLGRGRGISKKEETFGLSSESDPGEVAPALPMIVPDVDLAFADWQACHAKLRPEGRSLTLTETRRKALKLRLGEIGLDGWRQAIAAVHASAFLSGAKSDWRADIDWMLKPANLTKVMEGKYDDAGTGAPAGKPNGSGVRPTAADAFRSARTAIGAD